MFKGKTTKPADVQPAVTAPVAAPLPQPVQSVPPEMVNYISPGTVIEGNLITHEDLRVDGRVKGDIKTSARLWLGPKSVVEGNILAAEADVAGRITGTVESKGLLAIKSTCQIEGDIITKSLNVESGSSFNGRCKVGGDAEPEAARSVVANRIRQVASSPARAEQPAGAEHVLN